MKPHDPAQLFSDHEFQRLRSRICSRYEICSQAVIVGGKRFEFTRVLDPDQILEEFELAADPFETSPHPWQPYWAQAWESAKVLADELANRNLAGRHVLDLGCGLGLVGTVAAAFGGTVLMVDAAPPSLLFARINSWPWRERVKTRRLDWQQDDLPQTFSLIAGSDIVYDRAEWPYLESFWRRHLQPGGDILLAEPGRRTGDEFFEWIAGRDWQLREIRCDTAATNGAGVRTMELQPK